MLTLSLSLSLSLCFPDAVFATRFRNCHLLYTCMQLPLLLCAPLKSPLGRMISGCFLELIAWQESTTTELTRPCLSPFSDLLFQSLRRQSFCGGKSEEIDDLFLFSLGTRWTRSFDSIF